MSFYRDKFTANSAAVRVRFGHGIRHDLAAELDAIGVKRAMILTTPTQAELGKEFAALCGKASVGILSEAVMHTPTHVSEAATAHAREIGADALVSVGGGSTIGLGKAIALRTNLPQIVVPTTYAGSEATAILGQTDSGIKTTITDPKVRPKVILYDAELVRSLPRAVTVTSALNAIAHAAEGLYARDRTPISSILACEGLRAFHAALPLAATDGADLAARGETLYGAWLCGTVLGQVGMALHHKLCHTLGGTFDLPHAETHAIILPHAIAYNAVAVPDLLSPISEIFGESSPGLALHRFAASLGAPTALRDLGLKQADLDRATDLATTNAYWNPRSIERAAIRDLLQAAFEGSAPSG